MVRATRPPGTKRYVVPGNFPAKRGLSAAMISRSLRLRSSAVERSTCTLALCGPVLLVKTADGPCGMPTFETIETSSSARSSALTIDSIALTIRSVSSTRVPTGALRLMRNCASSDAGKNSVPMSGPRPREGADTRRRLAANAPAVEPTTRRGCASAHSIDRA